PSARSRSSTSSAAWSTFHCRWAPDPSNLQPCGSPACLACADRRGVAVPDLLTHLGQGFLIVLQPGNLLVLLIGLVLGMLVAVLPGLTLVMGVVLALPFTYKLGIAPGLILLTAMYVTGTYGGAFTSILFRIPGEPIDVPLLWDG